MREDDEQRSAVYELCAMTIDILRSPPLRMISFPSLSVLSPPPHISPAAFGSLFTGISIALMLFGSITFIVGFILMPLMITFMFLFSLVGIVSNLSEIARAFLWPAPHPLSYNFVQETLFSSPAGNVGVEKIRVSSVGTTLVLLTLISCVIVINHVV